MIECQYFNNDFLTAVQDKIPQKSLLAGTLSDLLGIDKDAVYRRLRGDVSFTFAEMAVIARRLGISLDKIAGVETGQCKSIRLAFTKHIDPSEVDYLMFEEYINALKFIKDEPDTKIMEGGHLIPCFLYFDYEYLSRVFMFRWSQNSFDGKCIPFHEVTIPDRMRELQKQSCFYSRHIKSTILLWDNSIFEQFVSMVKFYAKVRLINEEDVAHIKNELTMFLKFTEEIAITGKYKDTGNNVSLYVGDLSSDANLGLIESKNIRISMYWAFLLNNFSSFDSLFFEEINSWLQSALRLTTLISVSGEKIRNKFINSQQMIIDTL